MKTLKRLAPVLLVIAIVAFVYRGSLGCFFAQDDFIWLRVASSVCDFKTILSFFFKYNGAGNYRPISQEIYFLVNYRLFGLNAVAFHVANLSVHLLNTALVYCILRKLSYRQLGSFSGAVFYGVNSALYISIFWISAISESCMAMFYLLSVLLFTTYLKEGKRYCYLASFITFIAALMSKEQAISIPVILSATYLYLDPPFNIKKILQSFRAVSPFIATVIVYLIIRFATIGVPAEGPYKSSIDASIAKNLFSYIMWSLNDAYATAAVIAQTVNLNVVLLVGSVVGVLVVLTFVVAIRRQPKTSAFATSWFFFALLPVLPFTHHTQDYYVNVPCVGICILIASMIDEVRRHRTVIACCVVTAYCFISISNITYQENHSWVTHRAKLAQKALNDFRPIAPHLPDGAVLYFYNVDEDEYWAYNFGDLFKLYYPGKRLVTLFDGKNPLPSDYRTDNAFHALVKVNDHLYDGTPTFKASNDATGFSEKIVESIPFNPTAYSNPIDFAKDRYDAQLVKGWYDHEPGHRWMGKTAEAVLPAPRHDHKQHTLTVKGTAVLDHYQHKEVLAVLKANDKVIARSTISQNGDFIIEGTVIPDKAPLVRAVIELDQTFKPSEVGNSTDSRDLGVSVAKIQLL